MFIKTEETSTAERISVLLGGSPKNGTGTRLMSVTNGAGATRFPCAFSAESLSVFALLPTFTKHTVRPCSGEHVDGWSRQSWRVYRGDARTRTRFRKPKLQGAKPGGRRKCVPRVRDAWAVQTVSTDRQTHRVAFPASLSLLHPSGASLWQWKPTCQSF